MQARVTIIGILASLMLSCSQKNQEEVVHVPVTCQPTEAAETAITPEVNQPKDDPHDLANQLRDPDLLNRLDDPGTSAPDNPLTNPNRGKPVMIKGSDLPPDPTPIPPTTPLPPSEKPELLGDRDGSSKKSP
ncbi:MAG: hypothetical protein ACOVRB_01210 [Akkermansiaceae bacterium]